MEDVKLWDENFIANYKDGIITVKDNHNKRVAIKEVPKLRLKSQVKAIAEEMLTQKFDTQEYYSPATIADELGMVRQQLTPIIPKMTKGLHYLKGDVSSSVLITEYGREVLLKRYGK